MAVSYMRIVFIGTVAVFGFNITSGIMQGLGDSKSPLYFLAISTILNSILDVVFVYFLDLSVEGAAIATVIAQTASFIFSIFHINRKSKDIKIKLFKTDFDSKILKRIVAIGLPAGLQNTLFTLGVLVLQSLINRQGEEFLAGFGAANKIDSLVFMLIASFASALTAYVGQNVGAKKLDRVKKGVNSTKLISSIIRLSLTVLILAFSRPLLMLFATDEPVIAAGQAYLVGVLPFYIVLSALFLFNSALRGAGKSVVPLIASILSILLRVPSAYIITAIWGAKYMFLSYGVGWAFSILISGGYYISGRWKTGDLRSQ
jgi:putative MATE family efflux protein